MVWGRFYVLRSAHSCLSYVYSKIATKTSVTPKHIFTESDLSGIFFIIHFYFSPDASSFLTLTAFRMLKLFGRKRSKKSIIRFLNVVWSDMVTSML